MVANHARKLASLLISSTPLTDGRYVADLINSNEPGSAFANAALVASSVEDPDLGDVGLYAVYAARDFADANGHNGKVWNAEAVLAQLDVMRENSVMRLMGDEPLH